MFVLHPPACVLAGLNKLQASPSSACLLHLLLVSWVELTSLCSVLCSVLCSGQASPLTDSQVRQLMTCFKLMGENKQKYGDMVRTAPRHC